LLNGHEDASASPFVIAIQNAGIVGLPSVINAVILLAAWSAGNSDVYAASRTLYALALQDQAPRIFRRCTKNGLPIWCVVATSLFGVLCYMATGGDKTVEAFNWLYNISSIAAIVTWWYVYDSCVADEPGSSCSHTSAFTTASRYKVSAAIAFPTARHSSRISRTLA
jgi:amino acid transporter